MINKICEKCFKQFIGRRREARFCSRKCVNEYFVGPLGSNWKGGLKSCIKCGLTVKWHWTIYCSRICANTDHSGEKNGHWKGGRYLNKFGYVMVRVNGEARPEHRCIMEKILGRSLDESEVVHHINHRKWDNRLSNLQLLNASSHASIHKLWEYSPRNKHRKLCHI